MKKNQLIFDKFSNTINDSSDEEEDVDEILKNENFESDEIKEKIKKCKYWCEKLGWLRLFKVFEWGYLK